MLPKNQIYYGFIFSYITNSFYSPFQKMKFCHIEKSDFYYHIIFSYITNSLYSPFQKMKFCHILLGGGAERSNCMHLMCRCVAHCVQNVASIRAYKCSMRVRWLRRNRLNILEMTRVLFSKFQPSN